MVQFIAVLSAFLVAYLLAGWLHCRGRPDWRQDVLAAGLLALACLGYFWRILFGDAYMPADGGDLISFLWPTYRFAAESLRSGQLPLWNTHLYGGAPHVADIQAGFLYPVNLLLFLLVPDFGAKAMQTLSVLHFWWAGLGMYVFLRSLRWGPERREQVSRPASLLAGIAFAFSDPFWVHFGNLNFIAVASWLPWVMACYVRALEEGSEEGKEGKEGKRGEASRQVDKEASRQVDKEASRQVDKEASRQVDKEASRQGEGAENDEARSPITAHRSPFTVHRSPITAHRSPITAHRSLTWAALAGLLLGVGTLAGHIQATLFIGMAAAIYGALWVLGGASTPLPGESGGRERVVRYLASVAVLAAVAFLIAAPVLLPALQLTQYTARASWSYQETVGYSLSPAQWIGFVVPGFFGRGPQLHWGLWPRVEVGYLGILPLALAALALLARRERHTWALAGLSGVAFLLSLGIYSIVHGWLTLLPGFDLLRAPARFALLVDFGLAALAGVGLHVLLSPLSDGAAWKAVTRLSNGLGWLAKVVVAVVVPLTLAALLLAQDKDPTVYLRVAVAAIAVMLFVAFLLASWAVVAARQNGWARPGTLAALAISLVFLDLASTGAYNDLGGQDPARTFDQPAIATFLAQETEPFRVDARTGIDQLWQPNTALLYGFDDVWGVANPSILAAYERYWEGMGSRSSRLYDFLNAKYVIARKDVVLDWEKFELAFDGDPDLNVYRNRVVLPRAQIIHEALAVDTAEAAWDAVHAPDFDPSRQVVVERTGPGVAWSAPPQAPPPDAVERVVWLRRTPSEIVLEVTVAAPGYLVLSEAWYPGWQAQIGADGRWRDLDDGVARANTAFQAVPLTRAGAYQVRLRFAPAPWRVGVVLSAVSVLSLVAMAGARRRT